MRDGHQDLFDLAFLLACIKGTLHQVLIIGSESLGAGSSIKIVDAILFRVDIVLDHPRLTLKLRMPVIWRVPRAKLRIGVQRPSKFVVEVQPFTILDNFSLPNPNF